MTDLLSRAVQAQHPERSAASRLSVGGAPRAWFSLTRGPLGAHSPTRESGARHSTPASLSLSPRALTTLSLQHASPGPLTGPRSQHTAGGLSAIASARR